MKHSHIKPNKQKPEEEQDDVPAENDSQKNGLLLPTIATLAIISFVIAGVWLAAKPLPVQIQGMIDTDEIRVSAKASGRLEELLAKEGDFVEAGKPLFKLSNEELVANVNGVRALELVAKAVQNKAEKGLQDEDLSSVLAVWQSELAAADVAAKTAKRMESLFAQGVVSEQQRDEAVALAKSTAEIAKVGEAQYAKALAGTRDEDREAASAQLLQAKSAVLALVALEEELTAIAPISGEITRRYANIGEIVPPGFPVFTMIKPDDIWVTLNVREDNFSGLRIGSIIKGSIPALEKTGIEFKVDFINPQGDFATWRATRQSDGYDVKAFEIRARPIDKVEGLRPGMSVLFDWPQNK